MSCLACDALAAFAQKGHTCSGGEKLSRRFFLAAAALPQLIALSPVRLLSAGEISGQVLDKVCAEAFLVADAMLKAEGDSERGLLAAWGPVADAMLEALKLARPVVHRYDPSGIARDAVHVAILDAEAAKAAGGV